MLQNPFELKPYINPIMEAENDGSIESLVHQAELLVERRSHDALPLAERIMSMAIAQGNPRYFALAKYVLAFYNCLVVNDYDKAIDLCEEVLKNLGEEELDTVLGKIYLTLGNSHHLKGEVFTAQKCYLNGLKWLESRKELGPKEKVILASFYYNLSLLLSSSRLNMPSEEYLEKAIAIYKELNNLFKLSKSYVAYASVFDKRKEHTKAIEMLYKALELDIQLNDPYSIALSKANLGILHMRVQEYDKGFTYIHEAFEFYESHQMVYETAMVKIGLAEALSTIGRKDEAIAMLLESEQLFVKLDNKQETTRVYEILSVYMGEKGDYKAAWEYHQKHTEGLKYFFDVEKTNALTRAKKEFESEQKEKESAILKEKNEEIKRYVTKLEHSNDQLKQFAGVASHDLREPLRMISSYTALLQKTLAGQVTPQQMEFMNFIVDGARRMDQLITDLLRLAKVDANPRIEEVNLNNVLEEIKMNMGKLIEEKRALIICPQLPKITADRTMMLQLFQNIVSNGIKYNESATPTIKIKFKKSEQGFELSIADNGIGIPENMRERAFQIFNRLPTKKEYSGSGIGLAICKKIVDSMEGAIAINEHTGGGTVFTISLPRAVICT